MAEFKVLMKGKVCSFKIENREIFMMSENTGGHMIKLGNPLEIKKNAILSRNKMPQFFIDFVNSWKKEDIEKVAKMETDEEMAQDMIDDFKLSGYEILSKDGL